MTDAAQARSEAQRLAEDLRRCIIQHVLDGEERVEQAEIALDAAFKTASLGELRAFFGNGRDRLRRLVGGSK